MNLVEQPLDQVGDGEVLLDWLDESEKVVSRSVKNRVTFRFEYEGKGYYAKRHDGVGWAEIIKNLAVGRLPPLDAAAEYHAIERVRALELGTMTPVACVVLGWWPSSRRSALVTRELPRTVSLEDVAEADLLSRADRRRLLIRVAEMTRRLHEGGVNHRDLYICHFHVVRGTEATPEPQLFLIDLHRAQLRRRVPFRWRVKDVAQLLYSILHLDFTRRDLYRFACVYMNQPLRESVFDHPRFWRAVIRRAARTWRRDHGTSPPAWLSELSSF